MHAHARLSRVKRRSAGCVTRSQLSLTGGTPGQTQMRAAHKHGDDWGVYLASLLHPAPPVNTRGPPLTAAGDSVSRGSLVILTPGFAAGDPPGSLTKRRRLGGCRRMGKVSPQSMGCVRWEAAAAAAEAGVWRGSGSVLPPPVHTHRRARHDPATRERAPPLLASNGLDSLHIRHVPQRA
ncbi:hypothetical protein E2C01_056761 [Portunus trituberculatus]|uniref:Uncharacterized protein n=1 Tax=Portunus trituberculatus TaxID=210409 RepID=A0A5B7GV14_PORTR|nr:hypothetical protein [Portunus trituberculatus]